MTAAGDLPPADLAAQHHLRRLGGRPSLPTYLRQMAHRRHFMLELARSRFRAENQQDRLGAAWIVIRPLINAAVYGAVFGLLLPSSSRPDNFVPFLVSGIFVFQFFALSLADGAKSISGNLGLVRTLHFPRALLPIATVLQRAYALVPMMVVLALLVLATGEPLRLAWLQVVPALLLATVFNVGIAFVAGRLTIHVRDIAQLIPFVTRLLFYTSGIFYAIERVVTEPVLRAVLLANPVHVYIALVRGAFLPQLPAAAATWWWGAGWAAVAFLGGFWFFWAAEERYGRE